MTTQGGRAPGRLDRLLDGINRRVAPWIEPDRNDGQPPRGTVDRLDRVIDGLLYLLTSALLIAVAGAVTYSVFTRYVLNRPPLWSEDVPMVFFIWMTFVALAVATRRGENIRVTFFIEKLKPLHRLVLELFMHALVIAMMAVIFWFSFRVIRLQLRGTMLSTGWSNAIAWYPLPIGMVLMTLYQFKLVRRSLRDYRRAAGDSRA